MTKHDSDDRAGIIFAASSYIVWGVLPVYWHALSDVPAPAITAWRIVLSAVLILAVTLLRGRIAHLQQIFRSRALLLRLGLTAALVASNWTIYVYSVISHQLVESSLGYFILPLISIALGVTLLGERLSRWRQLALVLTAGAVTVQAIAAGHVPWIALALALTFGIYGYLRKLIVVGPLEGLFTEVALLLPLAAGYLIWRAFAGESAFASATPLHDALLLAAGPVTAVPLALFAAGARRIRLSTLGFLQNLSPAISLLIAVLVYGEPFPPVVAATFAAVWLALVLVASEGQLNRLRLRAGPARSRG